MSGPVARAPVGYQWLSSGVVSPGLRQPIVAKHQSHEDAQVSKTSGSCSQFWGSLGAVSET